MTDAPPDSPGRAERTRGSRRAAAPAAADARPDAASVAPEATPPKAGRNLPAAVGVGLVLAGVVIGTLVYDARAFLAVVVVAVAYGAWELRRAIATKGAVVPLVPLLLGTVGMLVSAYLRGAEALVVTFGLTIIGLLVWRVADGVAGAARDLSASALVTFYPVFLGGFASLMLAAPDGRQRIVVFILVTVFSDIGGYAVGVLFGRHPMAPSLSPKKSWEGFGGSVGTCAVVGAVSLPLLLGGAWWAGRRARRGRRRCRHPGGPHRVEHQARPGHQGHGGAPARARRHDGPPRLARRRRAGGLGAAAVVRAGHLRCRPPTRDPSPAS